MRRGPFLLLFLFAITWAAPKAARADAIYGFNVIVDSSSNATNAATGEAQMRMTVSDTGFVGGFQTVRFRFDNLGPIASSISDVYFDDGTFLKSIAITGQSAGVDFSLGASPKELPRANQIGFKTTFGFLADSDSPTQPKGVNPNEWLDITLTLQTGTTYQTVLDALVAGQAPNYNSLPSNIHTLRVGIHVQGYADGGSESFSNGPPEGPPGGSVPVPLPAAATGFAALMCFLLARRSSRQEKLV